MSSNRSLCSEQTYFSTADFLSLYSYLFSLLALPINIFGIWLICYQTPIRMKHMKTVILNCHVWSLVSDLMLGLLTIPYVFFPVIAGTPLGVLTYLFDLNAFLQTYIAVACVAEVGCSIVLLFENRQNQTVTSSWKISSESTRKVFVAVNLMVPWLVSSIVLMRIPDQGWAIKEVMKTIPCASLEFFQLPVVVVTTETKSIGIALMVLLLFYSIQVVAFIAHSSIYLCISTKSCAVSKRTKQLKQRYFEAVCIQVSVPLAILAAPVDYCAFSIVSDTYNQTANNICFLIMSVHGVFSTIATITIYENYRNSLIRIFRIKRTQNVMLIPSKSIVEATNI